MSEDEKQQPLRIEVLEKLSTLIAAAFGFVAAFAWNESFKLLIDRVVSEDAELYVYFAYAMTITIFAVFLIIFVARATAKAKHKLE